MKKKNDFLSGLVLGVINLLIATLLLFSVEYVGPLTSLISTLLVIAGIFISIKIIIGCIGIYASRTYINWEFESKLANLVRDGLEEEALKKRTFTTIIMDLFIGLLFVISEMGLVYGAIVSLNGFFLIANIAFAIIFVIFVGLYFKARSLFDIDSPAILNRKAGTRNFKSK